MLITGSGSYEQGENVSHLCELLLALPVESVDCFVPRSDKLIIELCWSNNSFFFGSFCKTEA